MPGSFCFDSSSAVLNEGVAWAKQMALTYAHHGGDPVGLWIESALPGRAAFCIRDVAHMSAGAHVLGLSEHIHNMMLKFAASIAESRDWAAFWEINKDDLPAPVDYTNDDDFWFNLPANFDMIECCWRAYLLTGNRSYVENPVFLNFYERVVNEYVATWDRNGDGLVEGPMGKLGIKSRGIPSYEEAREGFAGAFDLLVWQHDGTLCYTDMMEHLGQYDKAARARAAAHRLRADYESRWWDPETGFFFEVIMADGSAQHCMIQMARRFPRGYIPSPEFVRKSLDWPDACVECRTYYPETCYRYDCNEDGLSHLLALVDPSESRRGYPEVSYSVIGSVVQGLMGIELDAPSSVLSTLPRLNDALSFAEVKDVAVPGGSISVRHDGCGHSTLTNNTDRTWIWKCGFYGRTNTISSDSRMSPQVILTDGGQAVTQVRIEVQPGQTAVASVNR